MENVYEKLTTEELSNLINKTMNDLRDQMATLIFKKIFEEMSQHSFTVHVITDHHNRMHQICDFKKSNLKWIDVEIPLDLRIQRNGDNKVKESLHVRFQEDNLNPLQNYLTNKGIAYEEKLKELYLKKGEKPKWEFEGDQHGVYGTAASSIHVRVYAEKLILNDDEDVDFVIINKDGTYDEYKTKYNEKDEKEIWLNEKTEVTKSLKDISKEVTDDQLLILCSI